MSEREELEADEAGQCANCGGRLVFEESRAHGRCAWFRPWLQNGSQPHQEEGVYIYEIGGKPREIDAEIFPLVKALNDGGIGTIASCSGHGNKPGSVILADGREIILARSYAEARAIEQLFPDIHGERKWGDAEHERLEAQLMLLIHKLNWSDGTSDATQTLVAANIRHAVHKLVEDGALVSVDQVDARVDEAVRAIEAIKATRAAAASADYTKGNGGFEVVPLVWRPIGGGWYAETEFGEYRVYANADYKRAVLVKALGRVAVEHPLGAHDTLEAAKAVCEADHRERVSKLVRGVDVSELVEAVREYLEKFDVVSALTDTEPTVGEVMDAAAAVKSARSRLCAALPTAPEVK